MHKHFKHYKIKHLFLLMVYLFNNNKILRILERRNKSVICFGRCSWRKARNKMLHAKRFLYVFIKMSSLNQYVQTARTIFLKKTTHQFFQDFIRQIRITFNLQFQHNTTSSNHWNTAMRDSVLLGNVLEFFFKEM